MGIYIPGMEMPETCLDCFACHVLEYGGLYCEPLSADIEPDPRGRLANCPLVPVQPNGRLINADALFEKVYKAWGTEYDAGESNWFMDMINEAPTIIPATVKHKLRLEAGGADDG